MAVPFQGGLVWWNGRLVVSCIPSQKYRSLFPSCVESLFLTRRKVSLGFSTFPLDVRLLSFCLPRFPRCAPSLRVLSSRAKAFCLTVLFVVARSGNAAVCSTPPSPLFPDYTNQSRHGPALLRLTTFEVPFLFSQHNGEVIGRHQLLCSQAHVFPSVRLFPFPSTSHMRSQSSTFPHTASFPSRGEEDSPLLFSPASNVPRTSPVPPPPSLAPNRAPLKKRSSFMETYLTPKQRAPTLPRPSSMVDLTISFLFFFLFIHGNPLRRSALSHVLVLSRARKSTSGPFEHDSYLRFTLYFPFSPPYSVPSPPLLRFSVFAVRLRTLRFRGRLNLPLSLASDNVLHLLGPASLGVALWSRPMRSTLLVSPGVVFLPSYARPELVCE